MTVRSRRLRAQGLGLISLWCALIVAPAAAGAQDNGPLRDAVRNATFAQATPAASPDSAKDGAAIGALVGGVAAAVIWGVGSSRCHCLFYDAAPGWAPFAFVGIGAGTGAAIGYFADKAHGRVSLSPSISRKAKGVRLAVRF